jgi:serine/threonine protein kinase
MAPEQMRGERAITRSDIWALAVVSAELVNGSHPFLQGETSPPADWQSRLQSGIQVVGSRPAALAAWLAAASDYRAYRRPDAKASLTDIGATWQ